MAVYPRISAITILGMVLVALLWALCFPLIVTGALHAPSPLLFAALRALLAGILLVAFAALIGACLSLRLMRSITRTGNP